VETNYQYLFTKSSLNLWYIAPVVDYEALFGSHHFSDQEVEKVQFKAYRYFLGVGRKHPLAALSGDVLDAIQMSSQITSSTFWG
jgi:hypothetical protein